MKYQRLDSHHRLSHEERRHDPYPTPTRRRSPHPSSTSKRPAPWEANYISFSPFQRSRSAGPTPSSSSATSSGPLRYPRAVTLDPSSPGETEGAAGGGPAVVGAGGGGAGVGGGRQRAVAGEPDWGERVKRDAKACGVAEGEVVRLMRTAVGAREGAYAPYSNFQVGAAALTENGQIVTGANVENASYPVGTCAERCCLAKAVTDGHREFKAMAVATSGVPAASPCGMCRQFMSEFCARTMPIFMLDRDGKYATMTMEHLLPMGFGPDNLKQGNG